mgnify:FL=1
MRLRHVVLLAIAFAIFMYRMRPARFVGGPKPADAKDPNAVKITQFYAAAQRIGEGDKTMLCYGVENARAVRLNPAIEPVWPAAVRCFDVVPPHTTTYHLTAEDAQGQALTAETTIVVGPPTPKLVDVSVNKLEVRPGELVTLCFKARNAANYEVSGMKPAVAGLGQVIPTPERGCFADHPRQTRNYVVKVTGPGGEDSETVTVVVK